jgi:hypothetical protein
METAWRNPDSPNLECISNPHLGCSEQTYVRLKTDEHLPNTVRFPLALRMVHQVLKCTLSWSAAGHFPSISPFLPLFDKFPQAGRLKTSAEAQFLRTAKSGNPVAEKGSSRQYSD